MENTFFQKMLEGLLTGQFSIIKFIIFFTILLTAFMAYFIIFKFDKVKEMIIFFENFIEKIKAKKLTKSIAVKKQKERIAQELVFIKTLDQNEKIIDILNGMLHEFNADRIYIMQYHNTGYFKTGMSQLKTSNTYEICANGVCTEKKNLQNIPISLFAAWNYHIRNRKNIFFANIDDLKKDDLAMFETLRLQGVKSTYCTGLYTSEGFPIGFYGIDYCKERVDLDFESRMAIVENAKKIARLLG